MTDQTPVEAAARAMFERGMSGRWEDEPEEHKNGWRSDAADALASLAQHRDDIARVMADAVGDGEDFRAGHPGIVAEYTAQTDAVLAYLTGGAR